MMPMLQRNLIELIILLVVFAAGLGIYLYTKRKADHYESDLVIRKREEIRGPLEN